MTTAIPGISADLNPDAAHALRLAFRPAANLQHAQRLTRRLATSHYENFPVISILLPRHLRQDFCNVYSFCRIADDLGDEVGDTTASLDYLDRLAHHTRACFAGRAQSALFLALSATIARHDLPIQPFLDLIDAFAQDQRVTRYDTFDQLLDYCRRSANPVGRLVLWMCGYRDPHRQHLSDQTCTALQLANFWQDVRRDFDQRNRIYIPRHSMARFNVTEDQIRAGRCDDNSRNLIRFEVDRAQTLFTEGQNLLPLLDPTTRTQISLYGMGGMSILSAIRRHNYDTLTTRPALSPFQKGRLILSALGAILAARLSGGRS